MQKVPRKMGIVWITMFMLCIVAISGYTSIMTSQKVEVEKMRTEQLKTRIAKLKADLDSLEFKLEKSEMQIIEETEYEKMTKVVEIFEGN